ncbi:MULTISPECIES: DUF1007 family protein [unclassified Beijerinckia]|uniref:DUF1007 family protein n=1 Tax=unclassified Beijerinckia TaxID=2638183 RepID=UPI0008957CE3|nr:MULTISPECIES: DUF1007 family protein [unclassified Beijerinckia]MDH7799290.1 ABC-type uncharacterized transport system substrate-binding protein [Beijerinckia sp. GAS462]SED45080.1 ABC-type uncharacterized transport system, substrate-binding protein [Beijerinckia sp. 28-YEA-48]
MRLSSHLRRLWATGFLAIGTVLALAGSASAHPHVFVIVKSVVVFGQDGKIAAIRHSWTFDDMYSAFATQGLGPDPAKLASDLKELAKVNVEQLEEASFFTFLRVGGKKQSDFSPATDYSISLDKDKIVTLSFTVPLKHPTTTGRALIMQVTDPTYFVAFDFDKERAVTMENAPAGCSLNVNTPQGLSAADQKRLEEVANTNDSPGQDFGFKMASRAIVACP